MRVRYLTHLSQLDGLTPEERRRLEPVAERYGCNDINDLGEMAGASTMADGQYRAVYKVPGSGKNPGYYDLGVLGEGTADAGNSSVAYAIGARGLIVGKS